MLPLKDDIKTHSLPIITYIILGLNVIIFIYEMSLGPGLQRFIEAYGAIPYNIFYITGISSYTTLFSSMFIHASFMHILGNMLFLWIFADNIEDRMGHIMFIIFYLTCGIAAALLHAITDPKSTIPMVGASGAISGVLGAYILLYPKARILALIPLGFFLRVTRLPSIVFLGIWILYQFLLGIGSLGAKGGGVAYFAHIGGFAMGILFAIPYRFLRKNKLKYKVV